MSESTFRPNGFPSYLTFEEGPDYGAPSSLAGRKMDSNATIFNGTFNRAVGGWGLPPPEIEDGTDGDVGQSEAEIVQKVYLKARGPCRQFEFFFTRKPSHVQRSSYGQINHIPYEAMTLHELRNACSVDVAWSGMPIRTIIDTYNPMGFFFAHVEDRLKNQSGMEVGYTCGGLCDVMNVWQVPIVPGMKLYIIIMKVDGKNTIVPYASLKHPFDDEQLAKQRTDTEVAVIDIGTVCVASNQPPIMSAPAAYVHQPGTFKPLPGTHTISDTTDPTKVLHNILRVNIDMLRWEYFS